MSDQGKKPVIRILPASPIPTCSKSEFADPESESTDDLDSHSVSSVTKSETELLVTDHRHTQSGGVSEEFSNAWAYISDDTRATA